MDYRRGGGLYIYDLKAKLLNRIVDSSDGQILNADLDCDGRRVVFAWCRGKGYRNDDKGFKPRRNAFIQIWAVNIDGSDLRQRVRCRFSVMNLTVSCGSTYATRKVWGFADETTIPHSTISSSSTAHGTAA